MNTQNAFPLRIMRNFSSELNPLFLKFTVRPVTLDLIKFKLVGDKYRWLADLNRNKMKNGCTVSLHRTFAFKMSPNSQQLRTSTLSSLWFLSLALKPDFVQDFPGSTTACIWMLANKVIVRIILAPSFSSSPHLSVPHGVSLRLSQMRNKRRFPP